MPRPRHGSRSAGRWLALASTCCTAVTSSPVRHLSIAGNDSTTAAVNVRSGPDSGISPRRQGTGGAQLTLQCQGQGGISVNGNATWDEVIVADRVTGTITDDCTRTPAWNSYAPGTGACGSGSVSPLLSSTGSLAGADMQRACETQYPGQGLRIAATSTNSAYIWQCTGSGISLGIDVTAECRTQYGYGPLSAASTPGSAWPWHCHWNITQIQNVADWAISEKNSPNPAWSGRCEQFAEQAEGFQVSYPSALADYQTELNANRIHTGTIPPVAALAFYGGAKERGTLPYPPGTGRRSPLPVT